MRIEMWVKTSPDRPGVRTRGVVLDVPELPVTGRAESWRVVAERPSSKAPWRSSVPESKLTGRAVVRRHGLAWVDFSIVEPDGTEWRSKRIEIPGGATLPCDSRRPSCERNRDERLLPGEALFLWPEWRRTAGRRRESWGRIWCDQFLVVVRGDARPRSRAVANQAVVVGGLVEDHTTDQAVVLVFQQRRQHDADPWSPCEGEVAGANYFKQQGPVLVPFDEELEWVPTYGWRRIR